MVFNFLNVQIKKRSQITIFIILFIFILFVLIMGMHFRNSLIEQKFKNISPSTDLNVQNFEVYFENCVEEQVDKTLDILFKQGGILYKKDYGELDISDANNLNYGGFLLSKVIDSDIYPLYYVSKNYKPTNPIKGLFVLSIYGVPQGLFNKNFKNAYFGKLQLPYLCSKGSLNNPNSSYGKYSCPLDLYNIGVLDEDKTIQLQLNKIISSKIYSCLDNSKLKKDFNISLSEFNYFDVFFTEDSLKIVSDLKISFIQNSVSKKIIIDYDFPIRVKKLYSFVNEILKQETNNIFFDISKDYVNSSYYDSAFKVVILKNYFQGTSYVSDHNSDLIIVYDTKSPLPYYDYNFTIQDIGKGYLTFIGIIENRRPFLEYISNLEIASDDYSLYKKDKNFREGKFNFIAYDPDNDDLYSNPLLRNIKLIDFKYYHSLLPQYHLIFLLF